MKKLLTFLLALAASIGTMLAEKVQIGDLFYYLDDAGKKAQVTSQTVQGDYSTNPNYEGLTTATIPSSVEYENETYTVSSIGDHAFKNSASLTTVIIPNSVTSIGARSFQNCSNLESINIPSSVTHISIQVFDGCTSLPVIDNIRYADTYLVEAVDRTLSTYTIREGTRWIGSMAFSGCPNLTSVIIPNSVEEIGYYSFSGCISLESFTILATISRVDPRAFSGCTSLQSINVETENPNYSSIDGVLFNKEQTILLWYPRGKQGEYSIPNGVTNLNDGAFGNCNNLTAITIPSSVSKIHEYVFMDCNNLVDISIPNSVIDITPNAFFGCRNLVSFDVDANNPNYCSIDGVIYSKDQTELVCFPSGKQSSFSIPNHVTTIGNDAFSGNLLLTSVTIPNTVTTIKTNAFSGCDNLHHITIPSSVTHIEDLAFRCSNLQYVINYATTPQTYAYTIHNRIFCWEDGTGVDLSTCRLYVPAESVDAYRAAEGWSEFANILSINDFFNPADPQNPGSYRVTLTAEPEEMGTVTGTGLYAQGTEVEISATPNTGYHFVNWSDENTEATRTITLTKDTTLTATFAPNLYAITFNNYNGEQLQQTDVAFGTLPVYEGSTPTRLDSAYYTFTFKGWKPAVVIVSGDAIYTAEYDSVFLGTDSVIVSNQADIAELPAGTITHLVVEQSGRITISEPRNIHALTLHMGTNNAQVSGISDLTVEEAELVLHMPENAVSAQWFAFAVPFKVSLASGIRKEGETEPAISGLHFVIDKYDGTLRASEQNGWSRLTVTDTLYPGQLYMIAAYETPEAWRLTAAHPELIDEAVSVNVSANQSALGDHHSGWNGIANTLWENAAAELDGVDYVTTYNNQYGAYEVALMAEHEFLAAEPFFVQTPDNGSVIFSDHASSPSFAPMRMALSSSESSVYTLGLTEVKSGYTDKTYMTLNEDKVDTYIIGRDLEKMQRGVSAVPQLWTEAYDMRLAAHEVVYMDSVANVSLGLYAPIAGSYRLEIQGVPDQTSVLLTLDGNFVSTLSLSTIDLDLTEGDNTGYGLYICNASKIPTSIENLSANSGESRKLLRDGQIFILRGDKTYTIQGQQIK